MRCFLQPARSHPTLQGRKTQHKPRRTEITVEQPDGQLSVLGTPARALAVLLHAARIWKS